MIEPDPEEAGAEPEGASLSVPMDELERSRQQLRGLLHSARNRRFSDEFPRSRTMQTLLDARHRTVLMTLGSGALMMLLRRLPAGRAAALMSLYRGFRQGINLTRR